MVEGLGADIAAARERRNDQAGHAEAKTDRRMGNELVRCSGLRRWRRYVIEQAIVFVVVNDECRARPQRRI
jgi:hypothetical protein